MVNPEENLDMTTSTIVQTLLWLVAGGAVFLFVRRRRTNRKTAPPATNHNRVCTIVLVVISKFSSGLTIYVLHHREQVLENLQQRRTSRHNYDRRQDTEEDRKHQFHPHLAGAD